MQTPEVNPLSALASAAASGLGSPGGPRDRDKRENPKALKKQYASGADVRQALDGLPARMGPYLDALENDIRECEGNIEVVRRHQQEIRSDEARAHYLDAEDAIAARHEESLANRQRVCDLLEDVDSTMHEVMASVTGKASQKPQKTTATSKEQQAEGLTMEAMARHAAGMFPPPQAMAKAGKRG